MLHDIADLYFTLDVTVVITLGHQTVLRGLAVLGHHHERRGECRLKAQGEIQQYEWIGIPGQVPQLDKCEKDNVRCYPQSQNNALDDDEAPTTNGSTHCISNPIPCRQPFISYFIHIHDGRMIVLELGKLDMQSRYPLLKSLFVGLSVTLGCHFWAD